MKNRVYGIIGIKSVMSNWNADFTGRPKTIGNGEIFGSDKALKYSIKKYWENRGDKVLYIKSFKVEQKGEEKEKIQPRDLAERYEQLFENLNDKEPSKKVLKNLFSAIDVLNFGATFAEKKQNISITGAVQVGQGFNKYKDSRVEVQDILSPFRNSNEKSENADASTLGTKIMSDEAHYFYPFVINPENYNCYLEMGIEGFTGYTKEAYNAFKEASLLGATALNTNSKMGCENEFAMFIECKEESKLYLPDLSQYVDFSKGDDISNIDISKLDFIEKFSNDIDSIELYYNPCFIQVKTGLSKVKKYNIFTKEEI
ncbi:UNVERIFIED_CONTAM: CRISPR-associated protein Csh2 [Acetivibrio alkalicellulosi]